MITAVDTCILIDILEPDPDFGPSSKEALRACIKQGAVEACEVVWAEIATVYGSKLKKLLQAMDKLGIEFSPITKPAALRAAKFWHAYRVSGGKRDRIAADFLIGGHAVEQCDRLLTRDKDFYREYFKPIKLIRP